MLALASQVAQEVSVGREPGVLGQEGVQSLGRDEQDLGAHVGGGASELGEEQLHLLPEGKRAGHPRVAIGAHGGVGHEALQLAGEIGHGVERFHQGGRRLAQAAAPARGVGKACLQGLAGGEELPLAAEEVLQPPGLLDGGIQQFSGRSWSFQVSQCKVPDATIPRHAGYSVEEGRSTPDSTAFGRTLPESSVPRRASSP